MSWRDELREGDKAILRTGYAGKCYPAVVTRITDTMIIVESPECSIGPIRFWKKNGLATRDALGRDRLEEA